MATTYAAQATFNTRIQAKLTRTDELGTAYDRTNFDKELSLLPEDVEFICHKTYNVVSEDPTNIPLDSFTDSFGNLRSLESVRALLFYNRSTTAWVKVGGISTGPSDPEGPFWSDGDVPAGVNIAPGGTFLLTSGFDGYPVDGDVQVQAFGDAAATVDVLAVG